MALEPNKIHHLPVRITYTFGSQAAPTPTPLYFSTGYGFPQLPSPTCVESTYTATCSGLIPVFVHDNDVARIRQSTRNKKVNKEEDCAVVDHLEEPQRGSVCLKSLVKAICLSSPEIIPSRNTEDLKIYINSPVNRQTPTRSSGQRRPQSTSFHQASTPGLSSTLSRSSSAIPEEVKTEPAQPSPWLGQHTEHSESQHAQWMSMSMYGHPSPYFPSIGHQLSTSYYHTALTKSQGQTEQVLHPKSTLATVLQEKGTGKTTVTGRLIPAELHILETIFDDLASNDSSATGVEALARQSQQAITAILEVELMLSAPISMDNLAHAQNMLTLDNERQVYHALGLEGESGVISTPNQLLSQTDDSARSQPAASVKPEPAWPSSSSAIAKDNTTTTDLSSSSEGATFPATTSFRPFRPTSSKMALFEYQSRNRKSRREQHYTSDPSSMSRQNSPSNIFSRTRSRTRLGMGLTLEQVANVSNVVRLARKNPSALVERFLSGQTATSPIKRRSHGSGFTIDEVPRIVRVTPTVKTLNIATGSSKKRKTVSVVIDEAGRPIRWGVGAESPAKPTAITAVNQKSSQLNAHNAIKGDSMPSSGVTAIKKGPEYRAQFARNLPICYNCGITESGTWRTQGKGQRVCNACGLYWNSKGKVRPKELWEKDIARWNRRKAAKAKAAAANASAGGGAGRAATSATSATPAPKDMAIKAERKASTASNLPSKSSTSLNPIPNRLNVPTESSITTGGSGLKRNLSAVAEKEAQIHADSRRTQLTKARKEQLLNTDQTSTENTRTTEGNKENIPTRMSSNSGVLPSPLVNLGNSFKRENETPVKQQTTSILQSVNDNQPGSCEQVTPQLQRIKESPEAVLKRYLSETVFSLVPTNHLPLSDDGSRQSYGKSHSHSPAPSAIELGGEIGPIQDVDWGNVNDLAGLFKLSQSVESVGSVITTENQQQSQFSDPSIRVEHAQEQSDIAGSAVGDPHGSQPHEANLYQVNSDLPDSMDSEWEQLDPTSYNASSSSPACAPFDFSQLPPSSPPVVPTNDDELDQAAFWMSSPLTSPVDFGTISEKEVSPLKKVMNDLGDGVQDADAYDQAEALELISQAL